MSETLRALRPADVAVVEAFALPELQRSAYRDGLLSALRAVLAATDPDARALVAERNGQAVGIVVYGAMAGSLGTGRLQLIIVKPAARRQGIGTILVDGAVADMAEGEIRLVIVEIADDPALGDAHRLLRRRRFRADATVADYFRDGVGLAILRRDLDG